MHGENPKEDFTRQVWPIENTMGYMLNHISLHVNNVSGIGYNVAKHVRRYTRILFLAKDSNRL